MSNPFKEFVEQMSRLAVRAEGTGLSRLEGSAAAVPAPAGVCAVWSESDAADPGATGGIESANAVPASQAIARAEPLPIAARRRRPTR